MCAPRPGQQAVLDAACELADRFKVGGKPERLSPPARRLVAAVDEYRDPERREQREP